MIHHWKDLDLEITDFEYHLEWTPSGEITPSQTSNLKHVEIIKLWDKPTYDTSLESSWLRDHEILLSILFLLQHNCIISRLSSVQKKTFDISRKGSHPHPTPTIQQILPQKFIVFIRILEYY